MTEPEQMSDDDTLVLFTPAGYVHRMLWVSYVKRALASDMKTGKRLRLLELLNGMVDWYITEQMVQSIEPMCDTCAEMMREALSLDGDKDCKNSFDVLTSRRIFGHFLRLHPSFLAAIKLREQMTAARNVALPTTI